MLEKEKIVREQRLAEAIDRNYMGLDGKFGIILKSLGFSVIAQNSGNYEVTEWEDVYDYPDEDKIPVEDIDAPIHEIGKVFDGLKFGAHMEISYMNSGTIPIQVSQYHTVYEPAEKIIKVSYKGYIVFLEAEGELISFLPNVEWEDIIDKFYEVAARKQKEKRKEESLVAQKELKEQKLNFLQRLRVKWGI